MERIVPLVIGDNRHARETGLERVATILGRLRLPALDEARRREALEQARDAA